MPTWSTYPHANVPNACQSFNFVYQKAYQFFNYFSNKFFNFSIFQSCSPFANFKNIWAILENLSRETENFNFDICKISLRSWSTSKKRKQNCYWNKGKAKYVFSIKIMLLNEIQALSCFYVFSREHFSSQTL